MVTIEPHNQGTLIKLIPNQSASWSFIIVTLAGISAVTLLIAIIWAIQGVWFILPFAGLELGLLGFFLYKVNHSRFNLEMLVIEASSIRLERGKHQAQEIHSFDRLNSEFIITLPEHSLSAAAIQLKQGEKSVSIGCQLNKEDIKVVIDWIKQSTIPYSIKGETKIKALAVFGADN